VAVVRFRHVYYSPGDDIKSVLDALPNQAQRSLAIEIYGLTDLVLAANVIAASNRGVKVRVMNDRSQSAGPADRKVLQMLVDAGSVNGNIEAKVVESERGAIDHLKLIVVDPDDGALADTSGVGYGSYNFSDGAQRQDNIYVYTNDPGEVAQAIEKFEHDWQHNTCKPEWQVTPTSPAIPTPPTVPATGDAAAVALQTDAVQAVAPATERPPN